MIGSSYRYALLLQHKAFSKPQQMGFNSGDDMDELAILMVFNRSWPKWEVDKITKWTITEDKTKKETIYKREKAAA